MNRFHDGIEFSINLVIPKPNNLVAGILQRCIALTITLSPAIHTVLSAIDLNDQP